MALPSDADPAALLLNTARLDGSGRLSTRALLAGLGWPPGRRLQATVANDAVLIHPIPTGPHRVGSRGDLAVPAPARDLTGLHPGDLALLVASPPHQVLIVHPAAVVTRLLTDLYTRQSLEQR
jgi:bifunctional DNA-binding transcriptional regulator/antitoxin component of YhaV-PrlF toxin-antitoxin module